MVSEVEDFDTKFRICILWLRGLSIRGHFLLLFPVAFIVINGVISPLNMAENKWVSLGLFHPFIYAELY